MQNFPHDNETIKQGIRSKQEKKHSIYTLARE